MQPTSTGADVRPRVALIRPPGRYRGLKRALKLLLGAAIAAVLLTGTVHALRTWLLPAAPEPFDVGAHRAATIPDDRNAYILFEEARQVFLEGARQIDLDPSLLVTKARPDEWSSASSEVRAWVETNRPALETWRRGTDRPDALAGPVENGGDMQSRAIRDPWSGVRWALLEAGRLEEAGDPAAAWAWHKARLRAVLLLTKRGDPLDRQGMGWLMGGVIARARDWADRDDADVPALRRAIADVEAMAGLLPSDADAVRALYLRVVGELDDPTRVHSHGYMSKAKPPGLPPSPLRQAGWWLEDYLNAEPERSRRAARLIAANWLTQAERPAAARARAVVPSPLLFAPGPRSPRPPLAPAELAAFANAAPLLAILRGRGMPGGLPDRCFDRWPTSLDGDRRALAGLIVGLATRIYELETGKVPAGPEQLVPSVLPGLPGFYLPPEADD